MNGIATFRDEYWPDRCLFATRHPAPCCGSAREETMTSALAAFGIAVGGTSLICYLLMTRLQNRSANRGSSGHSCGPDGGNDTGGGWSISSWFGGDNSASDGSGNPSEAGGGDGGGCADGGGGGD